MTVYHYHLDSSIGYHILSTRFHISSITKGNYATPRHHRDNSGLIPHHIHLCPFFSVAYTYYSLLPFLRDAALFMMPSVVVSPLASNFSDLFTGVFVPSLTRFSLVIVPISLFF